MTVQILRRPEVEQITGLSRSTIYKLMNEGYFPKNIRLGPKAVGWLVSDLDAWIIEKSKSRVGGHYDA